MSYERMYSESIKPGDNRLEDAMVTVDMGAAKRRFRVNPRQVRLL